MEQDSKLSVSIILILTLLFVGIATLFYIRYTDKQKMLKINEQIQTNQQKLDQHVDYSTYEGKG